MTSIEKIFEILKKNFFAPKQSSTAKQAIKIDKVSNSKYDFPTIDFKFQNSGNATAFLWQYAIVVTHAELDVSPVLEFTPEAYGDFHVQIVNKGWGAAHNLTFTLNETTLNQLFDTTNKKYQVEVESGETVSIPCFSIKDTLPKKFRLISKEFVDIKENNNRWGDNNTVQGKILEDILINWSCTDENGEGYNGEDFVKENWANVAITNKGFRMIERPRPEASAARSNITYISMFNPEESLPERVYPISRKIPPGDIERFHIMVGAKKSCKLTIKFKFYVDKNKIIESEEFKLNISNPKDSWLNHKYADGSERKR